ncbi:MAG: RyR domain-containing protein [Alphaproteobacteria bacterium]
MFEDLKKAEAIAKVCHQANKAYCESIGDKSQPDWHNAPDWQIESAIKGVIFSIENPDSTPEDSHKSWFDQKEKDGWRYGKYKDEQKKTHPCMVAYAALPPEQQLKDALFHSIVKALTQGDSDAKAA